MIGGKLTAPWKALSLKARLIFAAVGLLAVFMWLLAFLSAAVLQRGLEELLAAQQFAFTRQTAAEIEANLQERIAGLVRAAETLPPDLSQSPLRGLDHPLLHVLFSGGLVVAAADGKVIAGYPDIPGRRNSDVSDRDYFLQPRMTGKPYVGTPVHGRAIKKPVLVIGVPVLDAKGGVRAVLAGVTDLSAPNFLNFMADPARIGAGEYYLVSLRDRIFVAAYDGRRDRSLAPIPPPGRNAVLDRMLDGYEGSGIAKNSEGIEKLYSGKRIPAGNWLLMSALPTKVAFAPVRTVRDMLFASAAFLTVLAVLLIGRMVRRMLVPLDEAGAAMRRMTDGRAPLAPLPPGRDDEVGQLVGNFNRLVEDRRRYEDKLAESEQRLRLLVESAPEAIFVHARGSFVYANAAALALYGASAREQLVGSAVMDRVHPDYRAAVTERMRRLNAGHVSGMAMEQIHLKFDGTAIPVEASAVPFRHGDEDGILVFVRDIGARKALQREREEQSSRIVELSHKLVATQEEERRRLSAALHERTSPNLAALAIMLGSMARSAPDGEEGAMMIEDARALLDDTTASIREICAELRPPLLDYAGLSSALQAYAEGFSRRVGIRVNISCPSPAERLAPDVESNLFRVAQEAMTNCAKHAKAGRIDIILGRKGQCVTLVIADDGVGFDPDRLCAGESRPGLGLLTMQERVEFVGGTCEIWSKPGKGTRIAVSMPCASDAE